MPVLDSLWRATRVAASSLADGYAQGWLPLGGAPTQAGVRVDEVTALNQSAVWAANWIVSSIIGTLPLRLYQRLGEKKKREAVGHKLYPLLLGAPNAWMSAYTWKSTAQSQVNLWGNSYGEIQRTGRGDVAAIWPLAPNRIEPVLTETGDLAYRRQASTDQALLSPEDVLHLPGLGWNGLRGYSVVFLARESLGLGAAAEKTSASVFGNGLNPSGALKHPSRLSQPARKNLRESMDRTHGGPTNSRKLLLLEEGMEFQTLSMDPAAAELLGTRRFHLEEVARWFNIPLYLLRSAVSGSGNDVANARELILYTLLPWCTLWEQEVSRKLLRADERDEYFAEFDFDILLRGDRESRYRSYAIGRQWGWFSANDVLHRENENPLPDGAGGDTYLVPGNMVPAAQAGSMMNKAAPPGEPGRPPKDRPKLPDQGYEGQAGGTPALGLRAVALDAAGRLVRKETNALRRSGRNAGAFLAWLDRFYPEHEALLTEALSPVAFAAAEAAGDATPESTGHGRAAAAAAAHCSRSRADLLEASGRVVRPDDLAAECDRLAAAWENDRPGELAAALLPNHQPEADL